MKLCKSFILPAASSGDLDHDSPGINKLSHEEGEELGPGMMY